MYIANLASHTPEAYAHLQFSPDEPATLPRAGRNDLIGVHFDQVKPPAVIYPTCVKLHTAVVPSHDANQDARLAWCWQFVGSGENMYNGGSGSPLETRLTPFTAVNKEMCAFRKDSVTNTCVTMEEGVSGGSH